MVFFSGEYRVMEIDEACNFPFHRCGADGWPFVGWRDKSRGQDARLDSITSLVRRMSVLNLQMRFLTNNGSTPIFMKASRKAVVLVQGLIVTLIAPAARFPAMEKASWAASSGSRWVMIDVLAQGSSPSPRQRYRHRATVPGAPVPSTRRSESPSS
jgi:hypothetical protein